MRDSGKKSYPKPGPVFEKISPFSPPYQRYDIRVLCHCSHKDYRDIQETGAKLKFVRRYERNTPMTYAHNIRIPKSEIRSSMIRELSLKSHALGAVNLSQGFPDDGPPAEIVKLIAEASKVPAGHQYSDPRGAPALRKAIARKLQAFNGIETDPDHNIVVTCGATEGLMVTLQALFERGDQVITFCPVYENYFHQAKAAGLSLATVELTEPDFAVSAAQLENAWNDSVRGILLCNPCNPTGKVFSYEELTTISDFAEKHNLLILSDETYERFIWRGAHISIASLPKAKRRTVSIFSMGKTYSVTGWRVGYVVAEDPCIGPIAVKHDFATVCAPHVCQLALAAALELPESFYADILKRYSERKETLTGALRAVGLNPWNPSGSYFLWCEYSRLTRESDLEFANRLLLTAGVAGVPGRVFYPGANAPRQRIRFTFSKSLPTIAEAASRLTASRDLLIRN
jgi:aspartate/methionine/tyrosine aminotransferase